MPMRPLFSPHAVPRIVYFYANGHYTPFSFDHRRYSGSCIGELYAPTSDTQPSQVSPMTGSLHEYQTPAYTATGIAPGSNRIP